MKNKKWFFACVVLVIFCMIPQIASAAGSLDSFGTGLWSYYQGKSMSWVRSHAPKFEKISSERYLLDEAEFDEVELYLLGDFQDDKLVILQIMTPYPDYIRCNDDVKDITYSFAVIGSVMMGLDFEIEDECTLDDGTFMCVQGKNFCMFDLCPKEMGSYACSSVDYFE